MNDRKSDVCLTEKDLNKQKDLLNDLWNKCNERKNQNSHNRNSIDDQKIDLNNP